ncbi:cytochrome c oxidase subunit II [Microvirga thermotolerans]|uniref:Cytochrome aa3 subunit 2 n=1 Tax=Microvirga thermotolerans TaxID=2651334 RepID=A0A5P9JZB8_9HYPH|nr:cytochrome c oxidase subunit II [Microvirga thermotolerans]QFU17501.1 cytochrome c oxidase subunit II [Microvirga thermotolerans]
MRLRPSAAALLLLPLTGCKGWQSALDPHGPGARSLETLFWIFLAVLATVWALTMLGLIASLRARRSAEADPLSDDPGTEAGMGRAVTLLVALTALTVLALTGISYAYQKRFGDKREDVLTIKVTGHQWWWQIDYEDAQANRSFTTANEIHIPVGEPVRLKLESSDVIHSFWVPSLMGKMDNIPGRQNVIEMQADREGIYRGQCAEFCGWQHAHMSMLIVAKPKSEFDAWRDRQIASAAPPADDERRRGEQVFLTSPCIMCHSVRGTSAGGKVGPDLTHVGSRLTLAAGTLQNTRGNLAAWIVDPQRIKPGTNMPLIQVEPQDLNALVSYLEGLK